ncbi:MAG: hypothetical protein RI922_2211 [Bacteroidota bacterium]|jgi:hypothetical protein
MEIKEMSSGLREPQPTVNSWVIASVSVAFENAQSTLKFVAEVI